MNNVQDFNSPSADPEQVAEVLDWMDEDYSTEPVLVGVDPETVRVAQDYRWSLLLAGAGLLLVEDGEKAV